VRGKVSCNPALPSEFATTNNTASVPTTASSPTSVTSLTLPAGGFLSGLRNPTATVTSISAVQHVGVSCTLTVGSNTKTRVATIDTTATSGATASFADALAKLWIDAATPSSFTCQRQRSPVLAARLHHRVNLMSRIASCDLGPISHTGARLLR
jgi:hypothetical protein